MFAIKQPSPMMANMANLSIRKIDEETFSKLATRNTKDFVDCGVELINPFLVIR